MNYWTLFGQIAFVYFFDGSFQEIQTALLVLLFNLVVERDLFLNNLLFQNYILIKAIASLFIFVSMSRRNNFASKIHY